MESWLYKLLIVIIYHQNYHHPHPHHHNHIQHRHYHLQDIPVFISITLFPVAVHRFHILAVHINLKPQCQKWTPGDWHNFVFLPNPYNVPVRPLSCLSMALTSCLHKQTERLPSAILLYLPHRHRSWIRICIRVTWMYRKSSWWQWCGNISKTCKVPHCGTNVIQMVPWQQYLTYSW